MSATLARRRPMASLISSSLPAMAFAFVYLNDLFAAAEHDADHGNGGRCRKAATAAGSPASVAAPAAGLARTPTETPSVISVFCTSSTSGAQAWLSPASGPVGDWMLARYALASRAFCSAWKTPAPDGRGFCACDCT